MTRDFSFVPLWEENEGSTLLGMNGGIPESPDGSLLVYARKRHLDRADDHRTEIWVCHSDLSGHRKVYEVVCGNHNGPSATFINQDWIVFRGQNEEGFSYFLIYDIMREQIVYGPIIAKESHREENGLYPFSISDEYVGRNPSYPQIGGPGIYTLHLGTGEIRQIVDSHELLAFIRSRGLTPNEHTARMSHVQLNPSATKVMMRLSVEECKALGALGCYDMLTREWHLIPDKPIHQLWYDDESYMAMYHHHDGTRIVKETSRMNRYSLDGEILEPLGGIGNHIDGSPDRKWFVSDTAFPGSSIDILLYRKGELTPAARLDTHSFDDAVFGLQVHPNPTFSRDGARVYFNRMVSPDRAVAGFVNVASFCRGSMDSLE